MFLLYYTGLFIFVSIAVMKKKSYIKPLYVENTEMNPNAHVL